MNTKLMAFAFSVLSLAGGSIASADEGRNMDPACVEKHAAMRDKKLAKFDLNGDGKLDESERAAMKAKWQEKRAERVARFDLNKDGVLDDAERANMRRAFVTKMFERLDVRKSGQLTPSEVACTRIAKNFAALDTDRSGTLTLDELVNAPKGLLGGFHHGRHNRGA